MSSRISSSSPRDFRAPLVDLGVGARGRVDDGRGRARLVADPDEVVQDRLLRQLLDDPRARSPAGEPRRDDRHVEPLERPRHVDPLAARERQHAARPVPVPELEDRDGQRAVERGVESDGDDHERSLPTTWTYETSPKRWWTVRRAYHATLPGTPTAETESRGDERCVRDQPTAREHAHLADLLPAAHGQRERRADDDALDERAARPEPCATTSAGPRASPARGRTRSRRDRRRAPRRPPVTRWYCASPHASSAAEIGIPLLLVGRRARTP